MPPHPISEKVHSTFLAFPKNLSIPPVGGCCLQKVLEGRASLGKESCSAMCLTLTQSLQLVNESFICMTELLFAVKTPLKRSPGVPPA